MNCPKCDEKVLIENTDNRQEWVRETYYCKGCDKEYIRLVTYQTQSGLIFSDKWEERK